MNKDIIKGLDELLRVCRPISLSVRWNKKWLCSEYQILVFEEEDSERGSGAYVYKFAYVDGHSVFVSRERFP